MGHRGCSRGLTAKSGTWTWASLFMQVAFLLLWEKIEEGRHKGEVKPEQLLPQVTTQGRSRRSVFLERWSEVFLRKRRRPNLAACSYNHLPHSFGSASAVAGVTYFFFQATFNNELLPEAEPAGKQTNETNQSEVALCCRLRFVALLGCNSSEQNLFWGGRKLIFLNKRLCLFTMKQKRNLALICFVRLFPS